MILYKISGKCAFRLTAGFAALTILLLMNGVGAISNNDSCIAINNSYITPCAEFDNVDIPIFGNITSFVIEATHPTYNVGGDYSCATNFTNCPSPGDPTYPNYPDYPFPANVYTLFDDGETVIQAVREAYWWQPRGMNASVNSNTPETDIHYVRISRKIAGANEWPQFFVLYNDGNARLIPHPPVESTSVCFGSSVIIGPATVAERPIANISSVRYISSSKTMEVIYREGGSAILSLNEVNRSMARVKVTVNFSIDSLPFATFRSMYVSDGNADVDHVRWQDVNGVIHDEQIMAFQGGEGSAWLFYRSNWSKHNPSGPDIAIKNFIAPTPLPAAKIEFTYMPPYGSFDNLRGKVFNVNPADYKIAVYIYVSGWWTKPYWDYPLTSISSDGSWITDITTGGSDQYATKVRAYLVPNGYNPPSMSGQQIFPAELETIAVAKVEAPKKQERMINFSGRDWIVKYSVIPEGPGLNYFSDTTDSVWVDEQGQLHLKIIKVGNIWYSSEVILKESLGYGEYVFYLASKADKIDKNAVLGMFTWDTFAPSFNYREMDIEISRWGQDSNDNSQFVVQPWSKSGNMHRFNADFAGNYSVQSFNWSASKISFKSLRGLNISSQNSSDSINSWVYTGSDIPPPGGENARINLWLFDSAGVLGKPPSDGKEVEVIIREFKFVPQGSEIVLIPRIFVNKSAFPATLPIGGGNVTYSYKVVHTGNLALSNITLVDDKCFPAVYVSGDMNSNSELETTETWNYVCENRINETTTNTVTATGSYNGSPVSNSGSATVTVAIPIPTPTPYVGSSGGGGGGGGGGGISGENHSNVILKEKYEEAIYKDKLTSYRFKNTSNPVMFINITGNINAGLINTAVEVLKSTSTLVNMSPPSIVYKNFNLWVGTSGFSTSKNIKEATVMFRIENSWIDNNALARSEIKLVKWDNGKWITLETLEKNRDGPYTYFEGKTTSFSPFAITGIKGEVPSAALQEVTSSPAATPQEVTSSATATTGVATSTPPRTTEPFIFFLIMGIFVILAVIVAVYSKGK